MNIRIYLALVLVFIAIVAAAYDDGLNTGRLQIAIGSATCTKRVLPNKVEWNCKAID